MIVQQLELICIFNKRGRKFVVTRRRGALYLLPFGIQGVEIVGGKVNAVDSVRRATFPKSFPIELQVLRLQSPTLESRVLMQLLERFSGRPFPQHLLVRRFTNKIRPKKINRILSNPVEDSGSWLRSIDSKKKVNKKVLDYFLMFYRRLFTSCKL